MNKKNIIRNYEQVCNHLKKDNSEEQKQNYLRLFKELDIHLTDEFEKKLDSISKTSNTITAEIDRIETVLNLIHRRVEYRNKIIEDHKRLLGYNPENLEEIEILKEEKEYVAYRTNLIIANEIIKDLLNLERILESLKKQNYKKNKPIITEKIKKLEEDKQEKFDILRKNDKVLSSLYDYSIAAPFNSGNSYIQYLLIQLNPRENLKIKLNKKIKVTEEKEDINKSDKIAEEKDEKIIDSMPKVPYLGTVKPTNIYDHIEETVKEFNDINIPTNGLIDNTSKISIDMTKIND